MGKLSGDEKIKPILMEFYGSLINSTEAIREYTGLNLEEMLAIPDGRVSCSLATKRQCSGSRPQRRNEDGEQKSVSNSVNPAWPS